MHKNQFAGVQCPDRTTALYGDPDDCHYYTQCINGIAIKKECPADQHFNVQFGICTAQNVAQCVTPGM